MFKELLALMLCAVGVGLLFFFSLPEDGAPGIPNITYRASSVWYDDPVAVVINERVNSKGVPVRTFAMTTGDGRHITVYDYGQNGSWEMLCESQCRRVQFADMHPLIVAYNIAHRRSLARRV